MKTRIALFLCFLTMLPGRCLAQNPTPPPPEQDYEKVTVGTSEVVVDAVIKDKKGHPVRDLSADDFEIYEDGARQQVQSFRLVTQAETGAPSAAEKSDKPAAPTRVTTGQASVIGVNAIALVFDRLSPNARALARKAASTYIEKEPGSRDFIGVFVIDQSLHVLQPFTRDHDLVRRAIEGASLQSPSGYTSTRDEVRTLLARQEQLDREASASGQDQRDAAKIAEQALNQMQVNMLETFERLEGEQQGYATIDSLLAVVNALRSVDGRKALIFFSEGISLPDAVLSQFKSVISNANRANVSVYSVDAAGLRATSSILDTQREIQSIAARRQQQVASGLEDRSGQPMSRVMERNEAVLRMDPSSGLGQLADQTGGFLVNNTNDIGTKLRQVNDDLHTYYVISYVPKNQNYDGRFRQIEVKLKRSGLDVQARKGYYAISAADASPVLSYEVPALAALAANSKPAAFPFYAEGFSFPGADGTNSVSVVAEIPSSAIGFATDSVKKLYRTDLSVVALIRDKSLQVVRKLSKQYLSGGPLAEMETAKRQGILFYRVADLPPGQYTVTVAAYDAISGKASVNGARVEVGSDDATKLRLSSLVLIKGVEKLSPEEQKQNNPFHYGEVVVYPNLGEPLKIATDKQAAFFLTVYTARGATVPPKLTMEIRQGGRAIARSAASLPPPDATGRIQYAYVLSTVKMQPGEYELMATVSDGVSRVARSEKFVLQ